MNVNDAEAPKPTKDRLLMIFERQRELMERYHDIEAENHIGLGSLVTPFHIDDPKWQYLLKDYAWRVTEELAESTEAHDETHRWEEAADALHFLVEMYLICGMSVNNVYTEAKLQKFEGFDMLKSARTQCHASLQNEMSEPASYGERVARLAAYAVVQELGCAMNCLKNKPWKRTQMETDVARFGKHLSVAFRRLLEYMLLIGMTDDDVYDIYFRKSEVNRFRQRSEY
jgi:hypothetical protein